MEKKIFERITPEEVGIPSGAIEKMLDKLENGVTEMHGLVIMRHEKICAEGWWAPYGPGIHHGLQSLSKTYSATAVGIAYSEGLLSLDEPVIDIFPDKIPENPSENLKLLTVRDVLCMGCGMETIPIATENWIQDFLATEIVHKPGTSFMYNSMGSTLLCAIVEKKSGEPFTEYIKTRLFDKIGIDSGNTMWETMPDGTAYGGGGFFATTEDNLRLMKLYKDGGCWNGERILSEDYVSMAINKQNDSSTEAIVNPEASDNFLGYGFQIWRCKPEGVYRADGAMGQFSIVFPEQDMIISINETATGAHWAQNTLNAVWEFLEEVQQESLQKNNVASEHLRNRMKHLAIAAPVFIRMHNRKIEKRVDGVVYHVLEGRFGFETELENLHSGKLPLDGITEFRLKFEKTICYMDFLQMGERRTVGIALDGSRRWNILKLPGRLESEVYLNGTWVDEDCFLVQARWIETCYENCLKFFFYEDRIVISENNQVGRYRILNQRNALAKQKALPQKGYENVRNI